MKKLILLITMILTLSVFSLSVKALTGYEYEINYINEWTTDSTAGNYFMSLEYLEIIDHTKEIRIRIPDLSYNQQTIGGIESKLILLDESMIELDNFDIDYLIGDDMTGVIDIFLYNSVIYADNTYYHETTFDYTEIKYITLRVMQTWTSLPAGYYEAWITDTDSQLSVFTEEIPVIFYAYIDGQYNKIYDTQFIFDEIPTEPTRPTETPTTESEFLGWKTITGEYYNFDTAVIEDFLNESRFLLYAVYSNINEPITVDTTITNNIPDGLENLMSVINANTTEGYMFLFLLLNILVITICLLLKLSSFIPIIISLSLYGLFIYFGVMNVFIIVILALIYFILLGGKFLMKEGGDTE